eukprot:NODE_775_length_1189_cov_155.585965_g625_i0.p1 GENE.NODE_775_length_1189_cov_155.585965_g625_i0~~NODE_775_length_1189_cov_155.585965_g625_i0.p1  ORF type:complete len:251 (+),score=116.58 NODE_775_length_1189_cov_155.585965_g625_i0:251-1003(+)
MTMEKDKDKAAAAVTGSDEADHPLDAYYKLLDCDLSLVDPKSEEFKILETYTEQTAASGRKPIIQAAWRMCRKGEKERFTRFAKLPNHKLLWHGTNPAVVAAILKSGLRIMPHSGGRVGKGIYFASENGKSAWYVRTCTCKHTKKPVGFMFLNEVALGKSHEIHRDDGSLTKPPAGYDSIVARGHKEPDPSKDVTIKGDFGDIIVPQGPPITQPEWSAGPKMSSFTQSEYLIYDEDQVHMKYILKMQFPH